MSIPSINGLVKTGETYAKDVTERVLATFVGAACGIGVAAGPADMFHASFWETMGAAGIAAAASLVKGMLARAIGDKNSASTAPGV
ncbi:hypothetical protein ACGFW5_31155 [Streptomyces sp. NPDC048416]|uniref:hypothetical protein n=1 Tax=Streptomyces sp. NPDC048416 TaxID=3365546 RepID=UPI00372130B7